MMAPKEELNLEKIDFEWVAEQTKIPPLKKALRLLELDGNYYTELISAVENRMAQIDPNFRKSNEIIDQNTKIQVTKEVQEFVEGPQLQKNQKKAEQEKNKGNEALKSNDLQEALAYYSKSIEYDNTMAASYCNRALVYLKLKDYSNVIKDCTKAIEIQNDYHKAYHRRGKAYFAQKQYESAYLDFKLIIEQDPQNDEVNGELRECRKYLTDSQINTAENKQFIQKSGGFKKVQIVEEEGDDDEEEIPFTKKPQNQIDYSKEIKQIQDKKADITIKVQKGLYHEAIIEISDLLKENQIILDKSNNEELEYIRAQLLSNLAFCHLQQKDYHNVVSYCNLLLETQPPRDIQIKAFLRRGMANEYQEKLAHSKLDFIQVKQLDPGNIQASQSLNRLAQIMTESENEQFKKLLTKYDLEQQNKNQLKPQQKQQQQQQQQQKMQNPLVEEKIEKQTKISDSEIEKNLLKIKEEGNEYFKKGDHMKAVDCWAKGIEYYEQNSSPKQIQLYLQLITNSCLCLSQVNDHQKVAELAEKAFKHDPNNIKALYRRGVAYQFLSSQEEDLIKQNQLIEISRSDLEKVVYLDSQNKQAQQKLAEVQKTNVELRVKIKQQQKLEPKVEIQQEKQEIEQKQSVDQKQQKPQSIQQEQLKQMGTNLTQNVIKDILVNNKLPETASIFEKNMLAFKKGTCQQIIDYVYQVNNLDQIYKNKDLPCDILLQILKSSSELVGDEEYKGKIRIIYKERLPNTSKFHLCVMQLSKKEKATLKDILQTLGLEDCFEVYKLQ